MATQALRAQAPVRSDPARMIYAVGALLVLLLMLLGFQQFYLHGKAYPGEPLAPPIRTLLIAHGVAMTLWVLTFVAQSLLVLGGNRRLHMAIGPFAVALAGIMVVLGIWLPLQAARLETNVLIWGLDRLHFLAIPLFVILTFGSFVAVGFAYRRRPAVHRPMMLLATLSILPAATDRITGLPDMYAATVFGAVLGPFFVGSLIGVLLLAARSLLTRSFDRPFAIGLAALVVINVLVFRIAPTDAWARLAASLVR